MVRGVRTKRSASSARKRSGIAQTPNHAPFFVWEYVRNLGGGACANVRARVREEVAMVRGVRTVGGRRVAAVPEKGEGHGSIDDERDEER